MADASFEPRSNTAQSPDLVVWTDDSHCLYLSFLEETFVNDLYQLQYCTADICGCTPPPHTSHAPATVDSPSTAQSQVPFTPQETIKPHDSKPNSRRKANPQSGPGRQRPLRGASINLDKRKDKCLSVAENLDDQHGILVPSEVPDIDVDVVVPSLRQPASSSKPLDCESMVPPPMKARRSRRTKRSRWNQTKRELCLYDKTETDQVVPSVS